MNGGYFQLIWKCLKRKSDIYKDTEKNRHWRMRFKNQNSMTDSMKNILYVSNNNKRYNKILKDMRTKKFITEGVLGDLR